MRGGVVGQPAAVVRIFRTPSKTTSSPLASSRVHTRSVSDSNGIRIRELDYRGREIYSSPRVQDNSYGSSWRSDDRPESKQSLHSETSYHTAYQDTTVNLDDMDRLRPTSEVLSDRISDTATIGRPPTPVTQVRSIGINTEPPLPTEPPPLPLLPQPVLRQRPSRAALLSNIRGGQDGIEIARLHSAVDKLAIQLASLSSQNSPDTSNVKRKLQAALDLLEDSY